MSRKESKIRLVGDGERPCEAEKPMTLAQAIETGDYLTILRAQRREIATSIPEEKGPAKAALHRQLALVSKEIEQLEAKRREADAEEAGAAIPDEKWDAEAI